MNNNSKYINTITKKHNQYLKLSYIIEEHIYKFNEAMHQLANELTDKYNKSNNIRPESNDNEIKDKDNDNDNNKNTKNIGREKVEHYNVRNTKNRKNIKSNKKSKLIKKLYFKISIHIHPDKTNDLEKINNFYIIKDSLENNILYKLLIIAEKYNIKYTFLDEYFTILDKENIILDNMINKINQSIVLKWANEHDPLTKLEILKKHIIG